MENLTQIKEAIEAEIEKIISHDEPDPKGSGVILNSYWESGDADEKYNEIVEALEKLTGWDWEDMTEDFQYLIKANITEMHQYLLDEVIPRYEQK